jgi:outer membrane protein assembly factor BamA
LEEVGSLNLGTNIELSGDPSFRITDLPKLQGQYVLRNYYDSTLRPMDTSSIQPSQLNSVFSNDLAFNWTDDPRNPTHGSYIRWSSQWAFPALKNALQSIFPKFASLASAAYIKNTIEFKTFFNLTTASRGRSVMAFRIMGGMIGLTYPSDLSRDVLLENRYYGGGTSSLRGWPSRSLLVSNNTDSARPYYGGYKTFETNLEWRYALFQYPAEITAMQQFLSAVHIGFFCDAGNVWDKDVPVALKNVAIAVGTGLRYYTLFGAVRVDFGFKFYDPYPSSPQNGLYSIPPNYIGGVWLFNRKGHVFHDTYNIEFALGQAF